MSDFIDSSISGFDPSTKFFLFTMLHKLDASLITETDYHKKYSILQKIQYNVEKYEELQYTHKLIPDTPEHKVQIKEMLKGETEKQFLVRLKHSYKLIDSLQKSMRAAKRKYTICKNQLVRLSSRPVSSKEYDSEHMRKQRISTLNRYIEESYAKMLVAESSYKEALISL